MSKQVKFHSTITIHIGDEYKRVRVKGPMEPTVARLSAIQVLLDDIESHARLAAFHRMAGEQSTAQATA